jgi:hypothetical protein
VLAEDCAQAFLLHEDADAWIDVTPDTGILSFAFLPFATTQPMSAALAFGVGDDFDPSGLFAYRPPSDARADEDIEPVVIEITRPRVEPGTQGSSSFHASYRGMTIPLDAIETPGAELEYPVTESPVALPAGTPVVIQGRFRNAAIFELRHARGTYVEHGSCIVPGALIASPRGMARPHSSSTPNGRTRPPAWRSARGSKEARSSRLRRRSPGARSTRRYSGS